MIKKFFNPAPVLRDWCNNTISKMKVKEFVKVETGWGEVQVFNEGVPFSEQKDGTHELEKYVNQQLNIGVTNIWCPYNNFEYSIQSYVCTWEKQNMDNQDTILEDKIIDCIKFWNREGQRIKELNIQKKLGDAKTQEIAKKYNYVDWVMTMLLSDIKIISENPMYEFEYGRGGSHIWIHRGGVRSLIIYEPTKNQI